MKKHIIPISFFLVSALLSSCIEPYQPKDVGDYVDILVIDGAIDATANTASVTLSHSMELTSKQDPIPEIGATITVEEQDGNIYPLTEVGSGQYESGTLSLDYNKQYRLNVKTLDGNSYQSAYIKIQQTPPIDSISWKPNADGVTIYANTHGLENGTGYYQWNFTETWAYNSYYYSGFLFENGEVTMRPNDQDVYYCWKTVHYEGISVGSSKKLSSDIIREAPLTLVPKASYQLSRTYSVIVQQRSLTEEGYNYWLQLQKTTEDLGGLFDPLPAQVLGNFTCLTDSEVPVLGFFAGSSVNEQRIFIHASELPRELQLSAPYPFCTIDSITVGELPNYYELYVIGPWGMLTPEGYLCTSRSCIDCTTQGGVTKKPDFWE